MTDFKSTTEKLAAGPNGDREAGRIIHAAYEHGPLQFVWRPRARTMVAHDLAAQRRRQVP